MKKRKVQLIGGMLGIVLAVAIIISTVFLLSGTLDEIIETTVAKTPDAILASAGISEGMNVSLPVVYYDQKPDECVDMYDEKLNSELKKRQFEWSECGYSRKEIEEGIIKNELDEKYLPVAEGGNLTPNKGIDMARWFGEVDGKSKEYSGILKMDYNAERSEFAFADGQFYPLDGVEFDNGDFANTDGHNHLFTMSFAVPFKALLSGEEEFEISADDDTFVFIGKNLVIDLGGIHEAATRKVSIKENGDIYVSDSESWSQFSGVNIDQNQDSIIRIFHADRDSEKSVFKIKFSKMNLNVVNTKIAESGEKSVQVAYDPSDLSFIAPLGENLVIKPDNTKSKVVLATIQGMIILIVSVILTSIVHFVFKAKDAQSK